MVEQKRLRFIVFPRIRTAHCAQIHSHRIQAAIHTKHVTYMKWSYNALLSSRDRTMLSVFVFNETAPNNTYNIIIRTHIHRDTYTVVSM